MKEILDDIKFDWELEIPDDDEKHIAAAMFLLQKAIALRSHETDIWKREEGLYSLLRDAGDHCQKASLRWTPQACKEIRKRNEKILEDLGILKNSVK